MILIVFLLTVLCGCAPAVTELYTNFMNNNDIEGRFDDLGYRIKNGETGKFIRSNLAVFRRELTELDIEDEKIRAINNDFIDSIDHLASAVVANEKEDEELFSFEYEMAQTKYRTATARLDAYKRSIKNASQK